MKWVTRERPKVDRIACPWLIARFVDPDPEFLYVPRDRVAETAAAIGAIPYDVADVELGHHGERCSFDAFLERYRLTDPALLRLAEVVRGADTGRPDLAPEAAGLLEISRGLSLSFADDHEMLRHGMVVYDALYAVFRASAPEQAAPPAVASEDLARRMAGPDGPLVVDVRRPAGFAANPRMLPGAARRNPLSVDAWARALGDGRAVVVYCVHGHAVSQGVARRLRELGFDAFFLAGGISEWIAEGRPVAGRGGEG